MLKLQLEDSFNIKKWDGTKIKKTTDLLACYIHKKLRKIFTWQPD